MNIDEAIKRLENQGHHVQYLLNGEEILLHGFPYYSKEKATNSPVYTKYAIHGHNDEWTSDIPVVGGQPILITDSDSLSTLVNTLIAFFKQSDHGDSNLENAKTLLEQNGLVITTYNPQDMEIQASNRTAYKQFHIGQFGHAWLGIEVKTAEPSQVVKYDTSLNQVVSAIIAELIHHT